MLVNLNSGLDFHGKALVIRAERQRVLASNIANADTPGYAAHNLDFKAAMNAARETPGNALAMTPSQAAFSGPRALQTQHMAMSGHEASQFEGRQGLGYAVQSQPSMDSNSVDLDQERAKFADNSVRYEATLRFINGQSKTILSAIQGQ